MAKQREAFARAGNLFSSPDFQWFIEECLAKMIADAEETALSVTKSAEESHRAKLVRATLVEVRDWVPTRAKVAQDYIKYVDGGAGVSK